MFVGALLYHRLESPVGAEPFLRLLDAASLSLINQRFNGYRTIRTSTDRYSRWTKLNRASVDRLGRALLGQQLTAVHFDTTADPDSPLNCAFDVRLQAEHGGVQSGKALSTAKLVVPLSLTSVELVARACDALWEELRSPYGFVYVGTSANDVFTELTAVPARVLGEPLSASAERRNEWLGFWQRHEDALGFTVRTAYWGNLLGSTIVDHLGGAERVLAEAPAAVSRRLRDGGVYLQSCSEMTRDVECEAARLRLAEYLRPVSIEAKHPDDAPELPYRVSDA